MNCAGKAETDDWCKKSDAKLLSSLFQSNFWKIMDMVKRYIIFLLSKKEYRGHFNPKKFRMIFYEACKSWKGKITFDWLMKLILRLVLEKLKNSSFNKIIPLHFARLLGIFTNNDRNKALDSCSNLTLDLPSLFTS